MDDLCKKFPRVCNCPYKEDIDNHFKNGKTAYYVCQWLKKTDYTISYSALKKYYDYLKENGEINPSFETTLDNEEIDEILLKKLQYAANNVDFDNMNPNVQVQWVLGLYKILFGDKHHVNMAADITSNNDTTHKFNEETLNVIRDAISRRNNNRTQ